MALVKTAMESARQIQSYMQDCIDTDVRWTVVAVILAFNIFYRKELYILM